jgi:putative tryptophan/tyrosine transport system substrate-binding protein
MKRRRLLMALAALTAPMVSIAQPRIPRVGFLGAASEPGFASQIAGLRAGLKELGYVEGKSVVLEFRWAEGKLDRLPALADELVRLPVDILITQGIPATRAAQAASSTVPIVMAAVGDAVRMGLVTNLARPGGNITGSTFFALELVAKRLELLKQAMPQLDRVAILYNPDNPIQTDPVQKAASRAAAALKIEIEQFPSRSPTDFDGALSKMAAKNFDAVVFLEEPMQLVNARTLSTLAARHQLASIGPMEFASAGVMIAYGVNFPQLYRRAAVFVDRILKGAKPGELPIEQASRFDLVINRKTANALGITIPLPLLHRADRVIE